MMLAATFDFDFGLQQNMPSFFILGSGMEATLFMKGLQKSNQSLKLANQRMVTDLRFLTLFK